MEKAFIVAFGIVLFVLLGVMLLGKGPRETAKPNGEKWNPPGFRRMW